MGALLRGSCKTTLIRGCCSNLQGGRIYDSENGTSCHQVGAPADPISPAGDAGASLQLQA